MGKTLKELNLKVGDKVIYDGHKVYEYVGGEALKHPDGIVKTYWGFDCVANFELYKRQPKFKVGDRVLVGRSLHEREVVYVQNKDERIFYTVVFGGDMPTSHPEQEVKPVPPKVTQESFHVDLSGDVPSVVESHKGFAFEADCKISYNRVDGVVDTNSIKMEKCK